MSNNQDPARDGLVPPLDTPFPTCRSVSVQTPGILDCITEKDEARALPVPAGFIPCQVKQINSASTVTGIVIWYG